MPPAPKKGDAKKPAEIVPDEGTQAVVLCDAFGSNGLGPLTLDLPVVNKEICHFLE